MLKELNLSSIRIIFLHDSNCFFDQYDSKSSFFSQKLTQSVEHLFEFDWKSWNFFVLDSKNWFFFNHMTQRIEPFFCMSPKLNFLKKKLTRITIPKNDSKNWTFSKHDSQNWIFLKRKRLTELNPSFHSQKWTLLFNMTQRMNFFDWLKKNWTGFLEYDSKNWARIFSKMTRKNELSRRMTQRIEPCVKRKVSKSGTCFWFWSKELFPFFFNLTRRIKPFSWIYSTELNLFSIWLKEFWTHKKYDSLNWTFFFAKKWLKECFEKKVKNDSTNWTF